MSRPASWAILSANSKSARPFQLSPSLLIVHGGSAQRNIVLIEFMLSITSAPTLCQRMRSAAASHLCSWDCIRVGEDAQPMQLFIAHVFRVADVEPRPSEVTQDPQARPRCNRVKRSYPYGNPPRCVAPTRCDT